MDNNGSKLNDKSELPSELELENTSGMWFAAAVSLFWLLVSSSTAPPMTMFARRRNGILPAPASSSR